MTDVAGTSAVDEVLAVLRSEAAAMLDFPPDEVDESEPLGSLGFDSIKTIELQGRIEHRLGASDLVFTPDADLVSLAEQVREALERRAPPSRSVRGRVRFMLDRLSRGASP